MATIIKKNNGSYLVRVSDGRTNEGKQSIVSSTYMPPEGASEAAIKRGLKEFVGQFETLVHSGAVKPGQKKKAAEFFKMTVAEYVNQHYWNDVGSTLSPNTIRFYHSVVDEFILPSFGSTRLSDITTDHVQALVDCLASTGARKDGEDKRPMSPGSVKRYTTVFTSIISNAWKSGYIAENKIRTGFVRYPKIVREEVKPYSAKETESLLEAIKKESCKNRLLILTALLLGLRRAEIVALKWDDVNWEERSISINKSAYKAKGNEQKLKSTKSLCSNRTVYFGKEFEDALVAWQAEQQYEKRSKRVRWQEQGFIFTGENGEMMSVYTPTRICSKIEEKYGIRHLKLHGLRHTCGSLMIKNGVDRTTVSKWLGHESTDVTEIYVHSYEDSLIRASDVMDRIVKEGNNSEDKERSGDGQ